VFDDEVLQLLEDHRIENEIVFPAAGYIEMALQAAKETSLNNSYKLSDFVFKEKITFRDGEVKLIQLLLAPDKAETFLLSIYSRTDSENWVLNASVSFIQTQTTNDAIVFSFTPGEAMRQQCATQLNAKEFYQTLQLHGVQYGARFRCVQHVWINDREALGLIKLPEQLQDNVDLYQVHPVLLDACLQVLGALSGVSSEHNLYLPAACQYIQFFSQPGGTLWSHVSLQSGSSPGNDVIVADIKLVDDAEQIVAELIRFRLQRTRRERPPIFSRQDTWFYHLQWQTHDISNSFSINNGKKRNWLVFTNDEGLGDELARQLEAGGDYCNVLLYKEVLEEQESEHSNNSCAVIEKHLKKTPTPLYGIIHLWSLCISPSDFNSSVTTSAMAGCNSVLWLVQALAKSVAGLPRLWLVTRGVQPVQPGESVSIEQSPLWGIGKVISFELPGLKCTRIDLDPQQTNADAVPYLVKQVLIDDGEDQVAFRSGVRFVPRLLPFPLATVSTTTATSLRSDSTYMITGGLGGLGLTVAKWMVQKGVRHLVLLGRSEPSSLVISSVDRMRQDHIDVMIAMADISDRVQLDCVLDKIKRNMPVLRGIIHAAGVLDDAPLLDLNADRLNIVMAPKVDGTWNLHQATIRLPLNFFVLFSSAVSVLGSPGQGNYAAANAYLDAMAHFRRNLGLPAISINWGPWAKVGLAAEATERLKEQNASTQHLVKVITADQGLEILEYLLSEPTPQVMVLPFDLKNLIELYPTAASMPFLADVGGSDSYVSRLYARPNLRQDYAAPRNEMERKLAALWQETLHIDRIGVHDSFFELGGDSVLAAQILTMTQKTFGIRINPQDAFQAFTITRLAEMLQVEILNEIEEMSEEEVQQQLLKRN
jgi:acyl transferase domain-containing protein/acyl carrier protein